MISHASGEFGVYVHVPFCSKKCDYCAFATWTDRGLLMEQYVEACKGELARADLPPATSVFFGGGTPSLLPHELLVSILDDINRASAAEVTVECNPDTVTFDLLGAYERAGVNRISLGVQSSVPHVLASLGRSHDQANVEEAVAMAADVGIERVNVDLIYGASGESLDDWRCSLETVLSLDPRPTHVSAYGLTVEPGTPLAIDVRRHPDDDDQADKYILADELLTAAGLENYEISNWAAPGHECRHNLVYWRQLDYRGIGCAAHSHENGRRWWNLRTPERYIAAVEAGTSTMAAEEVLDDETRFFEALELSLRMRDGIPSEYLDVDDLEGFVERRGYNAVLTRRGRLMANEIAMRLRMDQTQQAGEPVR